MRVATAVVAAAVLAACAPVAVRSVTPAAADPAALVAQQGREATLAAQRTWSFSGRVALSQGKDGGSGRIEWVQRGEDFDIRLSAPITGKSWRLTGSAGSARLEGLDGGIREGADAETLLQEATGWRIPVQAMTRWVRGARGEGASELSFDPQSRPALLQQSGWTVEYRAWDSSDPAQPTRVFARQGEASVRLAIDRWGVP